MTWLAERSIVDYVDHMATHRNHDQSGINHSGTRKSTWKPWTIEDAIARLDAKKTNG